jgi:hypothetical protein
MTSRPRFAVLALAGTLLAAGAGRAAEKDLGLTKGTPDIKSAGALAFGPPGILFIGDARGAAIFAVDTGDHTAPSETGRPRVEGLDEKAAALLGIERKDLLVNDLAVNPASGNAYLSAARGKGPDAAPVVLRVDRAGKLSEVALKDVPFAKVALTDVAEGKGRPQAITHLAFAKGRLYVAGLSGEEFSSTLRSVPFPFQEAARGTNVEFYHTSHGRLETNSPVRTFVPYDIGGEANLLAAYTCTPLVKVPVAELKPGAKIRGTTIAELGNMNRPLDIIVYKKGDKEYLLVANSARGVMKIPTEGIEKAEGLNARVGGPTGLKYETVAGLKGVEQLDRFDADHALVLIRTQDKALNLEPIELP